MRVNVVVALCLSFILALPAVADESVQLKQAETVAESWLALTDAGNFAQSRDEAATLYQAAVAKKEWEQTFRSVKSPLGTVKTRKLRTAIFATTLPGAPEGEYVVLQYDTTFTNSLAAVETITPMRDRDGSWRVSGYYVK